jgi:phosphatidylglycerophosphate synthase
MGHPFPSKCFNRWTLLHSFVCLAAGVAIYVWEGNGLARRLAPALCFYSLPAFFTLFLLQGRSSVRLPNFISLFRLAGAGYALLSILYPFPRGWILFAVCAASAFSDFFDGAFARRMGATPFGGKLDMELDAFFTFTLSICGALVFELERWILFMGLMRYCYVFLLLILPPAAGTLPWSRLAGKTMCGVSVATLVFVTAPSLPWAAKETAIGLALGLLGISFALDIGVRVSRPTERGSVKVF